VEFATVNTYLPTCFDLNDWSLAVQGLMMSSEGEIYVLDLRYAMAVSMMSSCGIHAREGEVH
jgi:hypothetical protein